MSMAVTACRHERAEGPKLWRGLFNQNTGMDPRNVLVVEHTTPDWVSFGTGLMGQLRQSVQGKKNLAWSTRVHYIQGVPSIRASDRRGARTVGVPLRQKERDHVAPGLAAVLHL